MRSQMRNTAEEIVMNEVIVVIGAGSIGQAIARRVSAGKHIVLADLRQENAGAAADVLSNAGFEVSTVTVDVSSRQSIHALVETATKSGEVTGLIQAAGVSPSQASPETILAVDLYGTAVVLEEFGNIIARGGAGVVIASQSGHRLGALTAEQNAALARTPADELLRLPMLQPDQVTDSLHAYQLAKRGNALRVMAEAVRWSKRGARINTISPGIIITPLAKDELTGPRGEGYRRMIQLSPAGRAGTPDEVGTVGALLMGSDGAFISGSDFLMDGGVTPHTSTANSRLSERRSGLGCTPRQTGLNDPRRPPPGPGSDLRRGAEAVAQAQPPANAASRPREHSRCPHRREQVSTSLAPDGMTEGDRDRLQSVLRHRDWPAAVIGFVALLSPGRASRLGV
jgi:NAD(P)-dependent dehydrogenase (short-subunit alcohol dehydrogenase family)